MHKILLHLFIFTLFFNCSSLNLEVKTNSFKNSCNKTEQITKTNQTSYNNNEKLSKTSNFKSSLKSFLLKGIMLSALMYNTKADNEFYVKTFDNIDGDIWSNSLVEDSQDILYVVGGDSYTEKPYLSNYYPNGTRIKTKILEELPNDFSFGELNDLILTDNNTIWSIGFVYDSGIGFGKHDILISSFDKNTFIPEQSVLYGTSNRESGLKLIQGVNNSILTGSTIRQFTANSDILLINLLIDFQENWQYTYGGIRTENLESMFYKNQKYYLTGSTNSFSDNSYDIFYLQLDQYGNITFFNTYNFNNTNFRACEIFVNHNNETLLIGGVGGNSPGAVLIKLDPLNNLNYALKIHNPSTSIRSGDGVVDIEIDNKIYIASGVEPPSIIVLSSHTGEVLDSRELNLGGIAPEDFKKIILTNDHNIALIAGSSDSPRQMLVKLPLDLNINCSYLTPIIANITNVTSILNVSAPILTRTPSDFSQRIINITCKPLNLTEEEFCFEQIIPTITPTSNPSNFPTTSNPSNFPTLSPTKFPTLSPTKFPTFSPTKLPTSNPSNFPTLSPAKLPTFNSTENSIFSTTSYKDSPSEVSEDNGFSYIGLGIIIGEVSLLCCFILCCIIYCLPRPGKYEF